MTHIPRTLLLAIALASGAAGAGCASKVDFDKVPVGARVDVTRQDGGVVSGTVTVIDEHNVNMAVGRHTRSIPRDQITSVQLVNMTSRTPDMLPSSARFREYTLPSGTMLAARLESSLGSDSSRIDEPVEATLAEPAVVDGAEVLPIGSVLKGVVTTAEKSGNVTGRSSLAVQFRSVSLPNNGETYALTAGMHHTAAATKGKDAKKIGIPAAAGAGIGALFGGAKGAGIGALIGGGAGTAVVLTTSGPEVRYARGTVLSLAIEHDIDVRVPIKR